MRLSGLRRRDRGYRGKRGGGLVDTGGGGGGGGLVETGGGGGDDTRRWWTCWAKGERSAGGIGGSC
eukprot:759541-Hanusia_phi.AAC.5